MGQRLQSNWSDWMSSVLTRLRDGANKEILGIIVSYKVKVKLVVSRGGSVHIVFNSRSAERSFATNKSISLHITVLTYVTLCHCRFSCYSNHHIILDLSKIVTKARYGLYFHFSLSSTLKLSFSVTPSFLFILLTTADYWTSTKSDDIWCFSTQLFLFLGV